jgi:hypothetical protein
VQRQRSRPLHADFCNKIGHIRNAAGQLIEHVLRILIEEVEVAELLAFLDHSQIDRELDVDGGPNRRHLQLDRVQPQLLDRPRAADIAIAQERDRRVGSFVEGVVKRVLEHPLSLSCMN